MENRRLLIGCEFTYVATIPTPVVFQVQPVDSPRVAIEGAAVGGRAGARRSAATSTCTATRACAPSCRPASRASGTRPWRWYPTRPRRRTRTRRAARPTTLPDDTLIYTLPSRYCLPDVLGDESWSRFGALPPGYRRVQAICDYVHGHLTFQYGSSTALSSAVDVNLAGRGVCRDFTHLAISFCRALNIPARYVFGYLPDMDVPPDPAPMDFAAWMEVWLGDRWWTFDPRNNTRRKGRVVIGRGRDASDVAMATTFGGPYLESMLGPGRRGKPDDAGSRGAERPACSITTGSTWARPAGSGTCSSRASATSTTSRSTKLRQRLVIVPPARHGGQYLRAHRLEVTGARVRRRVRRDANGNVVAWLQADQVASGHRVPAGRRPRAGPRRRAGACCPPPRCTARGCSAPPR